MSEINNINRRKFLGYFGCCACGLVIPSCTTAPITERRQLKLLPESTINRQAAQLYENVKSNKTYIKNIHDSLSDAVYRQLMSDVPYGVLLSGGLDSSITSALAKKFSSIRIESEGKQSAWWPQLHSFSVGLDGSPDLKAAKEVANHIGTVHHEIKFTIPALIIASTSIPE